MQYTVTFSFELDPNDRGVQAITMQVNAPNPSDAEMHATALLGLLWTQTHLDVPLPTHTTIRN